MAFDPVRGEMVLFGGYGDGSYRGDTWVWDGTDWAQRVPLTRPPARRDLAMAFDPASGEMVLFGGYSGSYRGDTWVWDGTDWAPRSPLTSPPARWGHAMAFDPASGEMVLFGGYSGRYLGDTWVWSSLVPLENQGPSVVMVSPGAEHAFERSDPQLFTVRGDDPQDDPYQALITVVDAEGAAVTAFRTAFVPSGEEVTGFPLPTLEPGEYEWFAQGFDIRGVPGSPVGPRGFTVLEGPLLPNDAPGIPDLLVPGDATTHTFGQPSRFTLQAVDPDSDPYKGVVEITHTTTGSATAVFDTRVAPSGVDSTGIPPDPIPPGEYTWRAKAVDARGAESGFSAPISFTVIPVN